MRTGFFGARPVTVMEEPNERQAALNELLDNEERPDGDVDHAQGAEDGEQLHRQLQGVHVFVAVRTRGSGRRALIKTRKLAWPRLPCRCQTLESNRSNCNL